MKKEKINNTELQRLVALKCNKIDFDEVSDEDIEKIEDITLNGKLINGRMSGINLDDVQLFPNLVILNVSNFEITQDFIQNIAQLKKLKRLQITGCTFSDIDFSILEETLKNVSFVGCSSLQFKYPKVKSVNVTGSEIDFENVDFSEVEDISVIESKIKNAYDLTQFDKLKRVNIDASILTDKEGEILQDIKVPEGTIYTHAAQVIAVDPR